MVPTFQFQRRGVSRQIDASFVGVRQTSRGLVERVTKLRYPVKIFLDLRVALRCGRRRVVSKRRHLTCSLKATFYEAKMRQDRILQLAACRHDCRGIFLLGCPKVSIELEKLSESRDVGERCPEIMRQSVEVGIEKRVLAERNILPLLNSVLYHLLKSPRWGGETAALYVFSLIVSLRERVAIASWHHDVVPQRCFQLR
ncbi:hypothetical protein M2333_001585 [Sphingobium sp. B11D3B]|nr:hypothetical protein [Sphingobium sp. B11D3B]MCW2388539.1 hypothetical protein [Sphingobium sp. B11D3B]